MRTSDRRVTRGIRAYISWIFVVSTTVFLVLGGLFAVGDLKTARERGLVDAELAAGIAADALNSAVAETSSWMSQSAEWGELLLSIGCAFTEQDFATGASLLDFSALHVLDADGRVVCSSVDGALDRSGVYRGASWIREPSDAPMFSAAFIDPLLKQSAFALAAPLTMPDGVSGTMVAIVPTAAIPNRLAAQFGGRLDTSFTLLDARTGGLVASSMGSSLSGELPAVALGSRSVKWIDGVDRIYASAPIPTFGWTLHAGVRESAVLAGAWNGILHTLAVVLVGLLVAGLAAAFVLRRVARPLRRLQDSIAEASEAAAPQPVAIEGPAEVASVAGRFNELIERRVHLEDRMRRAAYEDDLTGLATRALLADRLDAISRARPGARPGLFLVQLDRFDQARETFGHRVGDHIIREAADRLRTLASEGAVVARFGEASFGVLLPEVRSSDELVRLCGMIVAGLSAPEGRPVPISFNLSPAGIWEIETREAIEHAVAYTGIPSRLLTVELTEGALIGESHVVRDTLDRLRAGGMSIAIDDFGTGFSSLAYLRRFPIDQLKIDRSFVNELGSSKGAALTGAILGIAEALELRVVAEGVETEEQVASLQHLHCHRAQGFLFAKPVHADGFVHAGAASVLGPAVPAVRVLGP